MKKKGFTLIELLAVIVILAIIALIATPIILGIIEKAKMAAFKDSVYGLYDAIDYYYTSNLEEYKAEGKVFNFAIPESIPLEYKGEKMISGTITVDENGNKIVDKITNGKYYASGTIDKIDVVSPTVTLGNITSTTSDLTIEYTLSDSESGLGTPTCKYGTASGTYDKSGTSTTNSCTITGLTAGTTYYYQICVSDNVGNQTCKTGSTTTEQYVCQRATSLHNDSSTTYGSLGTAGTLTSGDAFDCDVNGDGTYDSDTERFYYVTDLSGNTEYAVLIYSNNVSGGLISNTEKSAYDSSGSNNRGPVTAILQLPKTTQWINVNLSNTTRAILNESGRNTTSAGSLPTDFSYEGYAARLLTALEVRSACGFVIENQNEGELNVCNYLMENTAYSDESLISGYWLESPRTPTYDCAWTIRGSYRSVFSDGVYIKEYYGVRPAIEVLKSDISY